MGTTPTVHNLQAHTQHSLDHVTFPCPLCWQRWTAFSDLQKKSHTAKLAKKKADRSCSTLPGLYEYDACVGGKHNTELVGGLFSAAPLARPARSATFWRALFAAWCAIFCSLTMSYICAGTASLSRPPQHHTSCPAPSFIYRPVNSCGRGGGGPCFV